MPVARQYYASITQLTRQYQVSRRQHYATNSHYRAITTSVSRYNTRISRQYMNVSLHFVCPSGIYLIQLTIDIDY